MCFRRTPGYEMQKCMFLLYAQMCFWWASNWHVGVCQIYSARNTVCLQWYSTFWVFSCWCGEAPRFYVCNVVVVRVLRMRFSAILWNAMKMYQHIDSVCNLCLWQIMNGKHHRTCLVRTAATLNVDAFTLWNVQNLIISLVVKQVVEKGI